MRVRMIRRRVDNVKMGAVTRDLLARKKVVVVMEGSAVLLTTIDAGEMPLASSPRQEAKKNMMK